METLAKQLEHGCRDCGDRMDRDAQIESLSAASCRVAMGEAD